MTPEREAQLLVHIGTLACLEEAHAFRDAVERPMTGEVYAALSSRIDYLARKEARR